MLTDQPASPPALGQALLFSRDLEIEIEKEERQGRYTLERFKRLRKDAYADCVALLAASKPGYEGLRRIAGIVGVHHLTVAAVRDDVDAGKTIDTLRDRLSRKMLTAVEILADRVLESPGSIPAGMLGMVIDQLTKNAELLGNRATARVESREEIDIYAHWDEIKEKLLGPGDVTELPAQTGLVDGTLPAIEAAPEAVPGKADIDAESADSPAIPPGRSLQHPTLKPTEPPKNDEALAPDVRNGGGRGSEVSPGGGQSRSGCSKQNFPGNGPQPPPI